MLISTKMKKYAIVMILHLITTLLSMITMKLVIDLRLLWNRRGRSFGFGSEINRFSSKASNKGKASQSTTTVHGRLGHLENELSRLENEVVELRNLLQKNAGTPNESQSSARPDVDDDMDDGYETHGNDIIHF